MKKIIFSLMAILLTVNAFAQKKFEGTITFAFDVKGEQAALMKAMLPTSMVIKTRGENFRSIVEGFTPMDILITNSKGYLLKADEKVAYSMIRTEQSKDPSIKINEVAGGKTKIAGLPCKKYEIKINQEGNEQIINVWASENIVLPNIEGFNTGMLQSFDGIKGGILKMELAVPQANSTITFEATSVVKGKLPASEFELPKGYEIKPMEDGMMGN